MPVLLRRIRSEGLSLSDTRIVASAMKGLQLPDFLESRGFNWAGKNLEFRRGKRSITLTIRASDEREMAQILGKILKLKELK